MSPANARISEHRATGHRSPARDTGPPGRTPRPTGRANPRPRARDRPRPAACRVAWPRSAARNPRARRRSRRCAASQSGGSLPVSPPPFEKSEVAFRYRSPSRSAVRIARPRRGETTPDRRARSRRCALPRPPPRTRRRRQSPAGPRQRAREYTKVPSRRARRRRRPRGARPRAPAGLGNRVRARSGLRQSHLKSIRGPSAPYMVTH